MDAIWIGVGVLLGVVAGAVGCWLLLRGVRDRLTVSEGEVDQLRTRIEEMSRELGIAESEARNRADRVVELEEDISERESELAEVRVRFHELEVRHGSLVSETDEKERALLERIDEMRGMEAKLKETFENLSNEALRKSTEQLMAQSKEILSRFKESDQAASKEKVLEMEKLLQPVKSELKRLEEFNRSLEQERTRETTSLKDQLAALTSGTGKLISALQGSGTAGKWGEVQLQRIVELAGMQDKVDFITQNSLDLGDGLYRPDMQVFLPGGRTMIIDAKVPVHDLDGMEAADEDGRKILAQGISNKVLDYAKGLHKRDYARLETAPDFVVMFIASESAFRMAMEGRPGLIEEAMHFNVVVASPSTLLPMLKAVNYGWRQEKLATEALNIQKLGKDIYDSLVVMKNHYDDLGRKIAAVGKAYNQFGGSLDSTVIPKARKMAEAGLPVREDQLVETAVVEFVERELRARDFAGLGTSEQPKLLE